MKKVVIWALVGFGVLAGSQTSRADWGTLHYGGYQPRWAFWTRFNKSHCTTEEERWLKFWHDYYDALEHYYGRLAHIDWVTYYKFHGYQINGGAAGMCGPYGYCGRPQYAPVFVSPTMQWAVPSTPAACAAPAPVGH